MRPPLRAWLLVATLLLPSGACDYFRPADPEPPRGSVILPDLSTPEDVLETMAIALEDKGQTNGASVWAQTFAESLKAGDPAAYRHDFWPDDVTNYQTSTNRTPPLWTLALERNFYSQFASLRGDFYRIEWLPDLTRGADDVRESVALLHRHYRIWTETAEGTITSTLAVGYADLTLVRFPDASWHVALWEDRLDPEADPSDPEAVTLGRRRLNTQ